jgi:hypothetical protein
MHIFALFHYYRKYLAFRHIFQSIIIDVFVIFYDNRENILTRIRLCLDAPNIYPLKYVIIVFNNYYYGIFRRSNIYIQNILHPQYSYSQ